MEHERNTTFGDSDSVEILIQRFVEGTLDGARADSLVRLLDDDPSERRRLARHVLLDSELRRYSFPDTNFSLRPESRSDYFDRLVVLEKDSLALSLPVCGESPEGELSKPVGRRANRRRERFFPAAWSAALIALFFIVAGYLELSQTGWDGDDFVGVARIAESVEAEWEDGAEEFKAGRRFDPDVLKLRSGVVKLQFENGAEVVLEGPTELIVKGKDEAFCQRGKLSVFVPPRAVGFEVGSPLATVVDLGTAFSIHVAEDKSDVHVLEGKVELKASVKEKFQLGEGAAALLDLRGEIRRIRSDLQTFFSEAMLRRRKAEYAERRREVWEAESRRLDGDASLVYRLEADKAATPSKTPGSRDGATALRFRQAGDRLGFFVQKECRDLTLLAVVRLDNLKNFGSTILTTDAFADEPGAVLWQIDRFGALRFHINDGGELPRQYTTPAAVDRKDFGTWITVALVADAERRTITHYLDGKVVASFPWNDPDLLRPGRMTLGNVPSGRRPVTNRFFNGDIETCLIFDRPLGAEELSEFYRNHR